MLLKYLSASNETLYSNDSSEPVACNILITNTHTASLAVTLSISPAKALSKGFNVNIFLDTMTAGEQVVIENCVLNSNHKFLGYAGTANLVSVKIDTV